MLNHQTINYFADQPVRDSQDDKFDRRSFSERIAFTIASRTETSNLVIGVYGIWGEGKTSLLHFVDQKLNEFSNEITTVWFNPWQLGGDPYQLLRNFILLLGKSLNTSLTGELQTKMGEWVGKYGALAASLLGYGEAAQKTADILKSSIDLLTLKADIERILYEANRRVVVFMDDIDRLDRNEIQLVFKMIKLSVNFERIVYILAFDDKMVASALNEQYGGGDENAGRDFLEKIIQVPLNLPVAERSSLRRFFYDQLAYIFDDLRLNLTEQQQQELWEQLSEGIELQLRTPRMIHRYCNALKFAIPILLGEVNLIDQVLIEGIRVCYPNQYEIIRNNADVFLQYDSLQSSFFPYDVIGKRTNAIYQELLRDLSPEETKSIDKMLDYLFPQFSARILKQQTSRQREPDKEQRIGSYYYFPRYFSYAVTTVDIADAKVIDFIANIARQKIDTADELLTQITIDVADPFLRKIETRLPEFSSSISGEIAVSLSKAGEKFSPNKQRSFLSSMRREAERLIYRLVEKVDTSQRTSIIQRIIDGSAPIDFAVEVSQWLLVKRDNALVSQEQSIELGLRISNRLNNFFQSQRLSTYQGNLPQLLMAWCKWGGRAKTEKCIRAQLRDDPQQVVSLVQQFFAEAWIHHIGEFPSHESISQFYDNLQNICNDDVIYRALQKLTIADIIKPKVHVNDGKLRRIHQELVEQHNLGLFIQEFESRHQK